MFNGFCESAEKVEERKQKILTGYTPASQKMTYEQLERAYAELRSIVLRDMLESLKAAVARSESVS